MATVRGATKWMVPISTTVNGVVTIADWLPPGARAFVIPEEYTVFVESGVANVDPGTKTATTFEVENSSTASPPEATVFMLVSLVAG